MGLAAYYGRCIHKLVLFTVYNSICNGDSPFVLWHLNCATILYGTVSVVDSLGNTYTTPVPSVKQISVAT